MTKPKNSPGAPPPTAPAASPWLGRTPICSRRWSLRARSTRCWRRFPLSASMFRLRPDGAAATIAVEVEGRTVLVPAGASAAAAVLLAGLSSQRETPVGGEEPGPYCMMGGCFDCLAEIHGV